jgi:manganese/zinc/iron transport system permease protein
MVILVTGILCAAACSMLGSFLILRRAAMMSDAISHAILPGLVGGYFIAQGPNLLAGFAGAVLASTLAVLLIETVRNTRLVDGGSAIGIVFPAMFALGTVLVSRYFANVHLDTDAILYGNIEFSSFDRWFVADRDLGPQSIWIMSILCVINVAFLGLFYKELKVTTFDPGLAASIGMSPILMHYVLMGVLSVTTVGAFTAVGAVLVVALVIVPAATAYLLTDSLIEMICISVGIGAASAYFGYYLAVELDGSIAGAIVTMTGVFFAAALLFSPSHGLVARTVRRSGQRRRFSAEVLIVHLLNHEGSPSVATEANMAHLESELRWTPAQAAAAMSYATRRGLIQREGDQLALLPAGRDLAAHVLTR